MPSKHESGFTLIELLITIAIVGILTTIAFPSYTNYTRRSYYSEIVDATNPYRVAVSACILRMNSALSCNAGMNGIPAAINTPSGMVAAIAVRAGVITVTPVAQYGILAADNYILRPTINATNGTITWTTSGGGVTKGYAR